MAVSRPSSAESIGGCSVTNGAANSFVTSNATRFLPVGLWGMRHEANGGTLANATEATMEGVVPYACIISKLAVVCQTAPAGADTATFTLRQNGGDTALVATVSGAARTATDGTNAITFAAGDRICVKVVGSATAAASNSGALTFRMRKV